MMRAVTPLALAVVASVWGHASVPEPPGPDPLAPRDPYAWGCSYSGPPPKGMIAEQATRHMSNRLLIASNQRSGPCESGLTMPEIWHKLGRPPESEIVAQDPWKREYRLLCRDYKYIVVSAGPDGLFGNEDDIRGESFFRTMDGTFQDNPEALQRLPPPPNESISK